MLVGERLEHRGLHGPLQPRELPDVVGQGVVVDVAGAGIEQHIKNSHEAVDIGEEVFGSCLQRSYLFVE